MSNLTIFTFCLNSVILGFLIAIFIQLLIGKGIFYDLFKRDLEKQKKKLDIYEKLYRWIIISTLSMIPFNLGFVFIIKYPILYFLQYDLIHQVLSILGLVLMSVGIAMILYILKTFSLKEKKYNEWFDLMKYFTIFSTFIILVILSSFIIQLPLLWIIIVVIFETFFGSFWMIFGD
jgi:hypothetical protein